MIVVLCIAVAWLAKTYKNICWTLLEDIVHDLCHILGKSSICRFFVRFVCIGKLPKVARDIFPIILFRGTTWHQQPVEMVSGNHDTILDGGVRFQTICWYPWETSWASPRCPEPAFAIWFWWWEENPELKELGHGFWTFLKRCREMSGNLDLVIRIY